MNVPDPDTTVLWIFGGYYGGVGILFGSLLLAGYFFFFPNKEDKPEEE